MAIYVLDTTTFTHLYRKHDKLRDRVRAASDAQHVLAATTVSVEELIGGWLGRLHRARTSPEQARIEEALADTTMMLGGFHIFPATELALDRFDRLVKLKLNVGRADLKIAAVALGIGATVVTDNLRDFGRVPGLAVEDWLA
ncbi:MAG TPA: PIN domain-containing protein [Urbifossiella sp.]|nr:PIN domain-containing protein [Urbifossiella sp.]